MIDDLVTRPLELEDLRSVAIIHCKAFPESALTTLGESIVARYYKWQLGPLSAIGAFNKANLLGFCFGGVHPDSMPGFIRENLRYIVWRVLTRPQLMIGTYFCNRTKLGCQILIKSLLKPKTPDALLNSRPFNILAIAVDPAYQGVGVGQVLMQESERIAQHQAYTRMGLSVKTNNKQAINFYLRAGWKKQISNGTWNGCMQKSLE